MPHLIVEASRNIAKRIDFPALVSAIHEQLCATGSLPVVAIKSRGIVHDIFVSGADARGDGAFLTALLRIQPGRELSVEQGFAKIMLDAIQAAIEGINDCPVSISVDVQRIEREISVGINIEVKK